MTSKESGIPKDPFISYRSSNGDGHNFTDADLLRCREAIESRDPDGLRRGLGLPADAALSDIISAIRIVRSHRSGSSLEKIALLKRSPLWPIIEASPHAVYTIEGFLGLGGPSVGVPVTF